ncbi:HNH endonuclease signature motif containing protein [Sphingomonas colocasiae]|uniref:HNH endonuclease n=1 Tax=Sphingomonas colocasiae TaxID=1848973 RepID=A0ABS7Q1J0_9SPHN|nr:HNH endonuclease signature motif containing protein [Sphingomonas colocasiae]MBY8826109.1 HNH endonuclease [Sphingomonas colocasiae]
MTSLGGRVGGLPSRVRPAPKIADQFYSSPEWRALVRQIKRQRGAFCERCGSTKGLIADHIVERRDGGADLDPSNIELLCAAHHAKKTAEARRRRALGRV